MKKSAKPRKRPSKKKAKDHKDLNYIPTRFKSLVDSDISRYMNILGMNHYRQRVMYRKNDQGGRSQGDMGTLKVAAEATVNKRYLTVDVKIYPWVIEEWKKKNMNDNDIHDVISHEIAHVATDHMYRLALASFKDEGETNDAWESLTTIVGRLIREVDTLRKTK